MLAFVNWLFFHSHHGHDILSKCDNQPSFHGHFAGQPRLACTRMSPFCISLELSMVQMAVTNKAMNVQNSSQIITTNKPTPSFLQAGCHSCHQTNSVRALKEEAPREKDQEMLSAYENLQGLRIEFFKRPECRSLCRATSVKAANCLCHCI